MRNHTHTQYTGVFTWKPKAGENHIIFSYMSLRITFIGSTNFLCFPSATGRRLQPPIFSGYNLREYPTPQFSGYNQKEATTLYVLRLQPEGDYNHLSLPRPTALKYK
jgi:hypothetical protein